MPTSVRLDQQTEDLLKKTTITLNTTKTLANKSRQPFELIKNLIGNESSGMGNLSIDGEAILRKALRKK